MRSVTFLALLAAALALTAAAQAAPSVVAYQAQYSAGTIIVRTSERRLYLVLGSGKALRYPVGVGKAGDHSESDWVGLGGYALGQITARKTAEASLIADVSGADIRPDALAASLALGALLRHYAFRKYLTKKK